MKISPEERAAIADVIAAGKKHGYGNMISHLAAAWVHVLSEESGEPEDKVAASMSYIAYPYLMHRDLMDRGEWDETFGRYR
jgi:hypothetical protein